MHYSERNGMHYSERNIIHYSERNSMHPISIMSVFETLAQNMEEENKIQQTRKVSYRYIAPVIISLGLLGNLATIFIIRDKKFKGVTYRYFLVLAISDFLSLLFSISAVFHLLHPLTHHYATAYWYSHFETFVINAAMGSSVLTVVCITVDRYFSVCRPHQFKMVHTSQYCTLGLTLSVFISIVVWFPTCFLMEPVLVEDCDSYHYVKLSSKETLWVACQKVDQVEDKWYNIYAWLREILISFLPIGIVTVLNTLLLVRLIKIHNTHHRLTNNALAGTAVRSYQNEDEKNLVNLLKAIMISFFITLLPSGVFNAAYTFNPTPGIKHEIFRAFAFDLQLLNHASNFYLYILLSKPVREVLQTYLNNIAEYLKEKILCSPSRSSKEIGEETDPSTPMSEIQELDIADKPIDFMVHSQIDQETLSHNTNCSDTLNNCNDNYRTGNLPLSLKTLTKDITHCVTRTSLTITPSDTLSKDTGNSMSGDTLSTDNDSDTI